MNYLQKMICDKTQCSPQNVAEVEDLMRGVILNYQTIDNLSALRLNKAIKDAYNLWVFMQTPDGKAEMERAEKEVMGL